MFEKVVLKSLKVVVEDCLDHFQFAYRAKRSVDDAVLDVLNSIYMHI